MLLGSAIEGFAQPIDHVALMDDPSLAQPETDRRSVQ